MFVGRIQLVTRASFLGQFFAQRKIALNATEFDCHSNVIKSKSGSLLLEKHYCPSPLFETAFQQGDAVNVIDMYKNSIVSRPICTSISKFRRRNRSFEGGEIELGCPVVQDLSPIFGQLTSIEHASSFKNMCSRKTLFFHGMTIKGEIADISLSQTSKTETALTQFAGLNEV